MALYAITVFKGQAQGYDDAVDELETQLELIDNANSVFRADVKKVGNDSWRALLVTGQ